MIKTITNREVVRVPPKESIDCYLLAAETFITNAKEWNNGNRRTRRAKCRYNLQLAIEMLRGAVAETKL